MGKGKLVTWGFLILALALSSQSGSHLVVTAAAHEATNPDLLLGVVFRFNAALPTMKAASGNIYYVAPNGNDSNPGTESQPWRTIQKAANALIAGDTVYIIAGTYKELVHKIPGLLGITLPMLHILAIRSQLTGAAYRSESGVDCS